MKKLLLLATAFWAAALMVSPAEAADEPIHLAMTTSYTDRHLCVIEVFKPWIEEVKQKSNGRLIIDFYNPNTICPMNETLNSLQKGQIALGGALATNNPGRLPANTVMNYVCLRYVDAYTSSMAYNELIKKYPQLLKEFEGIKILAIHTSSPQQLHVDKFAVASLEDIRGHKFLTSSADGGRLLKAMGANAVIQPNLDMYLSLSRGMAEGCLQPFAPLRSYKLDECTNYHSIMGLYSTPMYFGINQKVYDGLPDDLKAVIDETTADMGFLLGETLKRADIMEVQWMKEKGHNFNTLSETELKKMHELVDPVAREFFLNEMKKRNRINIDAGKLYEDALQMVEEMKAKYGDHQVM